MARLAPALLGLLILLALPSAQAAAGAVLVTPPTDREADLRLGEQEAFVFTVRNLHPANLAFVQVEIDAPAGWEIVADPRSAPLSPDPTGAAANASATVVITVRPASPDYRPGRATLVFTATTAERVAHEVHHLDLIAASPFVLGVLANPLPAPLDGPYGVFFLDLLAFTLLGVAVIFVQERGVRWIAGHARGPLVDLAIRKLRVPVLVLAGFVGLQRAVDILPPTPGVDFTSRVLDAAIYLLALYLAYKAFDSLLTYYGLKVAGRTETKLDDVLIPVFRKIAVVVVIVAGVILTLRRLEVDLTLFVAGGVVASMVLAFAAQETLSNFFSGLHLMVDQPFREGDWIQLEGGEVCRVEQVGLRSTRLYHSRRHEVIVMPNNRLSSNRVVNLMEPDPTYRVLIEVGVAYGSDVEKVRRILQEIAAGHPRVVASGPLAPEIFFTSFGDSALQFTLRVTLASVSDRERAPSEMRHEILRRFRAEGVEIPFPQRDLWLRGGAVTVPVQGAEAEAPRRERAP